MEGLLNGRRFKTGDIIVAVLIVLGIASFFIAQLAKPGTPEGELFVISQTTAGFRRVDALSSTSSYTVETPGEDAGDEPGVNTVRIEGGQVVVTTSNCSNQLCVEHDPIDEAGEQIVCLPHGLVVEVDVGEDGGTPLS